MFSRRSLILAFGPAVLVSTSYWAARPVAPSVNVVQSAEHRVPHRAAVEVAVEDELRLACERKAALLRSSLGPSCQIVTQPPFVLGGGIPEPQLDRIHRDVMLPTARALATCYFDTAPTEPITVLLFADERGFREAARRMDGRDVTGYYGYYVRTERRLMLNVATGYGTLGHELTHALAHFDCPSLPEWFDEGLAALHEQCDFSDDGLRLEGRPNWRGRILSQELAAGRLPSLEEFVSGGAIRSEREAIDYALSRYLCLYLQQRQLLAHYYRKLRRNLDRDPTGATTLRELLRVGSLDEVEPAFRTWLAATP